MDKEDVVHMYNGILCSHETNEIMPFAATWMDLEIIMLSEVSQTKTSIICYRLYAEPKKNDTSELIYKTETDSQTLGTKFRVPGLGVGEG